MSGAGDVAGAQANPPASLDRARVAAYELVTMAAIPGVALALARLNVFDALAHAGDDALLTAPELAALALPGKRADLTNLTRLLRMMAATKILREVVDEDERRFALTPVGRLLVDDEERGTFLPLLDNMQSPEFLLSLEHLHESVLDPAVVPFTRAHGVLPWEFMQQHGDRGQNLNRVMVGLSKATMPALLDVYGPGFQDVHVLVDVAGGVGAALGIIIDRYPHIKGINFDLPHVVAVAPPRPGVEHVGGSIFESVPSGGDAIFLKFILHSWGDEKCITILRNCYEALPAHGKVIAVDNMLPETIDFEGADPLAFQCDIHMMVWNGAGRERTERHMRELALAAGFKQVQVICKIDAMAVTEFRKLASAAC